MPQTFDVDREAQGAYAVDWSVFLDPADSISTSAWTLDSGLTEVSSDTRQTTGTAQAGAAKTITLAASGPSATDHYYRYLWVRIYAGTGAGQHRRILSYIAATKVCIVDREWDITPDSTSKYIIAAAVIVLKFDSAVLGRRYSASNLITTAASPPIKEPLTLHFRVVEK